MNSRTASCQLPARLDPSEVRRLVQHGRESGLLRFSGDAIPVEKKGTPVAAAAGLRSQWIDITPELASRWLKNNFRNRPVSDDVVTAYARDITNGVWIATHQGLAFNDRDELIDGQHRLLAVVKSAQTVRMMVTFGLPSKIPGKEMTTMDAVDRGRTRSVADQLKIQHGLKQGSAIAATTASIANLCCSDRTRRLSVGQSLEIYRAFQSSIDWVIENRPKAIGLRATGVLAGFAFAMQVAPAGRIQALFGALVAAAATAKPADQTPLSLLRSFLQSDDARLLNRGADRALAELVLQVIHLELTGARVAKLELSPAGANHYRQLQRDRVEAIAAMFRLPSPNTAYEPTATSKPKSQS